MNNTFDRAIFSLCSEIDELKNEVNFWREKYKEENKNYCELLNSNLETSKKGLANALLFAISCSDDENGNLVIKKEDRKTLAEIAARDADGFAAIVKQVQG